MTQHVIGRYKIIRELRRGGMASVYRAYDPHFEREVALKILPRELLFDPQFRARFLTEAKALASMEHTAIVPVYDFGEQDGQPYLVMRYMPGGSLEDRLRQGTLPLVEAARILSHLAPALDEAHARGMVHRDLKPANILFDQRNDPYITDFGVVKITGVTMTDTGHRSIGTPAYMSPEQARGEPDIDGRSDIFALGAVLFEMLTGKIPYDADTPAGQLVRRITDPVPNILELRPDLPAGVQEIIARVLAKRRYVRFSTATDLANALQAVAQGKSPKETLVFDKSYTPPSGTLSPPRSLKGDKPRIALRPRQETKPARKSPRWLFILAAAFILAGLFYVGFQVYQVLGIGTGGQQAEATSNAIQPVAAADLSPTPFVPVFGTVIELAGTVQYQTMDGQIQPLALGDRLPGEPDLHLWTLDGTLKVRLTDGPVLWLGEDTSITFLNDESSAEAEITVLLDQGSLVVKAPDLVVITELPEYQARVLYSMMGVVYEPALGRFTVDCLEGRCLAGKTSPQELVGGTRGGFAQGAPLPVEGAVYTYWIELGQLDIPTPTFTPSPTATLEPTPTQTPEPTVTNTSAPVYQQPVVTIYSPPVVYPTNTPRPSNPPQPEPTDPPPPTPDPNQG
jgi:hypothetical protein